VNLTDTRKNQGMFVVKLMDWGNKWVGAMNCKKMKYYQVIAVVFVWMLAMVDKSHGQALQDLEIFSENYPRAGYFRIAEFDIRQNYRDKPDKYEEWRDKFSNLSGIMGKTDHEELLRNNPHEQIWDWFNRYKKEFPNKFVMVHMNGRGRIPNYHIEKFSPGHWLYFVGADVLSDLPSGASNRFEKDVWIKVSDANRFHENNGRNKKTKDDITLVRRKEDGTFDWEHAEYVRLLEKRGDSIKVRRAMFGSKAKRFSKENTYAAPLVMEGPWGQTANMVWYYNLSTQCPKDKNGQTCADILVEELAGNFKKGGRWQHFDGVQFDVMMSEPIMGAHPGRRALGERVDINVDGVQDGGVIDGLQTYGVGVFDFVTRLRQAVGSDKIIAADGRNVSSQQVGNGAFNGIEIEGFPTQRPYGFVHWSTPINLLNFWHSVTGQPHFNYSAMRYEGPQRLDKQDLLAHYRLAFAGSVFTNTFILAYSWTTRDGIPELHEVFGLPKTESPIGWLGKPLGDAIHWAGTTSHAYKDVLAGRGDPLQPSILNGQKGAPFITVDTKRSNASIQFAENGTMVVTPTKSGGQFGFTLKDVPFENDQVYLELTMRSGKTDDRYPEGYLRSASVIVNGMRNPRELTSIAKLNEDWFTYRIYFGNAYDTMEKQPIVYNKDGRDKVDIEIVWHDATGPVEVSRLLVSNAPEIVYREFEYGTVVANLSSTDFTWSEHNVVVPAKDALFIRKK